MAVQQYKNVLDALLQQKMRDFADAFLRGAKELFVDTEGELIHPGEFGTYREGVTKDFLQAFVPQRMGIDSGFVITASGRISSQCDLVFYDRSVTPLLQNANRQRFFPVESVCAVGEIKSKMTGTELGDALRKLSSVKSLRDAVSNPLFVHTCKEEGLRSDYRPDVDHRDQMLTFIICDSFDFDPTGNALDRALASYARELPNLPACLRHNMVLSICDGLLGSVHNQASQTKAHAR